MSDNTKYYYLKLKEDFFKSDEMIVLQGMPDGYRYSDILLKMYLTSLRSSGRLMFRDLIPYTPQMIAKITSHSEGDVEKAIRIFEQLGLVEILDNGAIYMMDIQNFIGKSSTEADRIREYRSSIQAEKEKLLAQRGDISGQMSLQMYDVCTPENRDKSIENRDKSIENKKNILCSEPNSEPEEEPFITLTLNTREEFPFYQRDIEEYRSLYPAVDVEQEMRNMKGWCKDNPTKRKTKRGIRKFVNGWLAREQDKGGKNSGAARATNVSQYMEETKGWY